jgi:hypothetical protein
VGEVRLATELMIPAKMAGRLTVALMGSLQVWMAYLVARRYFDSVATGILAAAVLAVNPLLVSHSHYMALDVPLGLMVMLCLWAAWQVVEAPRTSTLTLAGLVLGLTITTRASGLLTLPVFLGAAAIAWRQSRPPALWAVLSWPGTFTGGLLLGLVLGYPGLLLHFEQGGDILSSSFALPPAVVGGGWAFLCERGRAALSILRHAVGVELLLLWLTGVGLLLWRRQWQRLLLTIFPPLYLLASLITLTGSVEGQQAVWLPTAVADRLLAPGGALPAPSRTLVVGAGGGGTGDGPLRLAALAVARDQLSLLATGYPDQCPLLAAPQPAPRASAVSRAQGVVSGHESLDASMGASGHHGRAQDQGGLPDCNLIG